MVDIDLRIVSFPSAPKANQRCSWQFIWLRILVLLVSIVSIPQIIFPNQWSVFKFSGWSFRVFLPPSMGHSYFSFVPLIKCLIGLALVRDIGWILVFWDCLSWLISVLEAAMLTSWGRPILRRTIRERAAEHVSSSGRAVHRPRYPERVPRGEPKSRLRVLSWGQ